MQISLKKIKIKIKKYLKERKTTQKKKTKVKTENRKSGEQQEENISGQKWNLNTILYVWATPYKVSVCAQEDTILNIHAAAVYKNI